LRPENAVSAVDDIRIKLETHLSELEEEIESLRVALSALDATAAAEAQSGSDEPPAAHEPSPRTPRARRSARSPRSPRASRAPRTKRRASAELERLLAETGGQEVVELARESGIDPAEVLARIGELERAGRSAG
jgi:hypothetical protein